MELAGKKGVKNPIASITSGGCAGNLKQICRENPEPRFPLLHQCIFIAGTVATSEGNEFVLFSSCSLLLFCDDAAQRAGRHWLLAIC
jgi:hypothetical protein